MPKFKIETTDHLRGKIQAPVILLEYGDYQCEFCKSAEVVIQNLRQSFGSKLAFVFRNFPITSKHPKAFGLACFAESSKNEKEFWKRYDALMSSVKISAKEINAAAKNSKIRRKIDIDISTGVRSGVNGTPCFFINGRRYDGEQNYTAMFEYIQKKLETRK